MFSFLKKEKKSPSDPSYPTQPQQPPIPGPVDDFVVVNRNNDLPYPVGPPMMNPASIYPSFNMNAPNNPTATVPKKEDNFLQGVPFSLNKEFSSGSRNDILAAQLSEIMAYCTRRLQIGSTDYEFQVEKSVLNES